MSFDPKSLKHYPKLPGVYLMKDEVGTILYVGKALSLHSRLKNYFQKTGDQRTMIPHLIKQLASIETIVTHSEKEALILENNLIKKHTPKYNTLFKDDKSYVSIVLNITHSFPTMRIARFHHRLKKSDLHFGPFPNSFVAKQTMEILFNLFKLRQCSDKEVVSRSRPCLLYGIKKCDAPCVGLISKIEYQNNVDEVIQFLKGNNDKVFKLLEEKINHASQKQEYEKAQQFLEQTHLLKRILEKQKVETQFKKNMDCIGLFRIKEDVMVTLLSFKQGMLIDSKQYFLKRPIENTDELMASFLLQYYLITPCLPDLLLLPSTTTPINSIQEIIYEKRGKKLKIEVPKKGFKLNLIKMADKNAKANFEQQKNLDKIQEKLLFDLQETIHLKNFPKRIECLDISSFGTTAVGAICCFIQGRRSTHHYRMYKIELAKKHDDYGAILEMMHRRLKKAQLDGLPDLFIIDGGKGHLNTAKKALDALNITTVDVIALTKEASLHTKGLTKEIVFHPDFQKPLQLDPRSPLLYLLQRIRDETHRFVHSYQKKRIKKQLLQSQLDAIPSIGPKKKKLLFDHFKSVGNLKMSTKDELEQIKGLNKANIDYLLDFIKNSKV